LTALEYLCYISAMKNSKYQQLLVPFLKRPYFKARDARVQGIPSRMLDYFHNKGLIERMGRGIYRTLHHSLGIRFDLETLVQTATSVSRGVVCLISALCCYELTDQVMREYWIAVPNDSKSPKREHIRAVRMRNMSLGKTRIRIGKVKIDIFDRERTVVDAFRYLSHEIAIKALQAYLKISNGQKPDLPKLSRYAKMLRVNLNPYILALTT